MFTTLQDNDFVSTVDSAERAIVIFTKKLCPHCKNMLKMLEKFERIVPGIPVFTVDSEDNPDSMALASVERVPTVCVVKGGKILARKTGLMNPREMEAFYESV